MVRLALENLFSTYGYPFHVRAAAGVTVTGDALRPLAYPGHCILQPGLIRRSSEKTGKIEGRPLSRMLGTHPQVRVRALALGRNTGIFA
jgi:hypothetical protein